MELKLSRLSSINLQNSILTCFCSSVRCCLTFGGRYSKRSSRRRLCIVALLTLVPNFEFIIVAISSSETRELTAQISSAKRSISRVRATGLPRPGESAVRRPFLMAVTSAGLIFNKEHISRWVLPCANKFSHSLTRS